MAYLGPMLINKMMVPMVLLQTHNLHLIQKLDPSYN